MVDNVGDTVIEYSNEGTDSINSSVTYTLPTNVENLLLIGGAAINGTGNDMANNIVGNSVNNQLDGGIGSDILNGGKFGQVLAGLTWGRGWVKKAVPDGSRRAAVDVGFVGV